MAEANNWAQSLAHEHWEAVEHEGLQLHDGAVWDAEDRLFEVGFPESAHTLRMMIYAFRQGRTLGRKEGRIAVKCELSTLLGYDIAKAHSND